MFKIVLKRNKNSIINKICRVCNKPKSLRKFDVDKTKKDGVTTRCRQCRREYMNKYRDENRIEINSYQNNWVSDNIQKVMQSRKRWIKENPEKRYAHNQVAIALKSGKLKRQKCIVCEGKAEAHHEDYTKPLDVIWLCRLHHKEHHFKGVINE